MPRDPSLIASAFIEQRSALERFITRRTGFPEAGRELVQEAWIKVQHVAMREEVDKPVAYLFRMAGNLAVDWLRQARAVSRHVSDEPLGEFVPCVLPGPEEEVQSRQEYELLCASIRELPVKCQEVFLLYRGLSISRMLCLKWRQAGMRVCVSPQQGAASEAHSTRG